VPAETYEPRRLLAALQEIGGDGGDGASLARLGLDFGGTPTTARRTRPTKRWRPRRSPRSTPL